MNKRPGLATRDAARGGFHHRPDARRASTAFWLAVALALSSGAPIFGADPPSPEGWVGMRVMARESGARLKIVSEVTAVLNAGSVFRINRVSGDWLWVDSGHIRGWIKKDAVVPFDEAAGYFSGVIAREPDNAHAHLARGLARHALRDYEGAVADETAALKIDPKEPWAYHNRAASRYALGQLDLALADADESIRLDPGEASRHANRASILFAQKDYHGAIASYSEAISRLKGLEAHLDDTGAEGEAGQTSGRLCLAKWMTARAECWAALSASGRALADYAEAERVDPADFATLNSYSWFLSTSSDSHYRNARRALELARQACELTGYRNHLCLDTLAAACAEGGDFPGAVRWITTALNLAAGDQRFVQNYVNRLRLFLQQVPYREKSAP